jgi:pyruvate formate lyase activating enzyme
MKIGGLQKFSLIDYPGKLAAVIFTQGCNFRCPYCHNADLVLPERFGELVSESEIISFLESRKGKIEALVITGGEPTLQPDLIYFIAKVKKMGFLVKLDTNGSRPEVIASLLGLSLVDYIAMDVKSPFSKYALVSGVSGLEDKLKDSIDIILQSGIPYEFRTTLAKTLVTQEDVPKIRKMIKGAKRYRINQFVPRETNLDRGLGASKSELFSEKELTGLQETWQVGV